MKRKLLTVLLSALILAFSAVLLAACRPEEHAVTGTDATIETGQATFIKELPSDITIVLAMNSATLTDVKNGETLVAADRYTAESTKLIIKKEYLMTVDEGENHFTITTSRNPLTFQINVRNLADPPSLNEIVNDPYYKVETGEGNGQDAIPTNPDPDSSYGKYLRMIEANKPLAPNASATVTFDEEYWDMRLRPYTQLYDRPAEAAGAYFEYIAEGTNKGLRISTNGLESGVYDLIELRGTRLLLNEKYHLSVKYRNTSGVGFCAAWNGNGFVNFGTNQAEIATAEGDFVATNANGLGNDIYTNITIMCTGTGSVTPQIDIFEVKLTRVETLPESIQIRNNGARKLVIENNRTADLELKLDVTVGGFSSITGYTAAIADGPIAGLTLENENSSKNKGEVTLKVAKTLPVGVYNVNVATKSTTARTDVFELEVIDSASTAEPTGITIALKSGAAVIPIRTNEYVEFDVSVTGSPKNPGFTAKVMKDDADVTENFRFEYGELFNTDVLRVYANEAAATGNYKVVVSTRKVVNDPLTAETDLTIISSDPETEIPAGNSLENLRNKGKYVENFATNDFLGNMLNDHKGVLSINEGGYAINGKSLQVNYPSGTLFFGAVSGYLLPESSYKMTFDVRFVGGEPSETFYFGFRNDDDAKQINTSVSFGGMKVGEKRTLSHTFTLPEEGEGGSFYMYMFTYDTDERKGVMILDNLCIEYAGGKIDLTAAGSKFETNFTENNFLQMSGINGETVAVISENGIDGDTLSIKKETAAQFSGGITSNLKLAANGKYRVTFKYEWATGTDTRINVTFHNGADYTNDKTVEDPGTGTEYSAEFELGDFATYQMKIYGSAEVQTIELLIDDLVIERIA